MKYTEPTDKEIEAYNIEVKCKQYKIYLNETDYKFNGDYERKEGEDLESIRAKRSEARKFIRENKMH